MSMFPLRSHFGMFPDPNLASFPLWSSLVLPRGQLFPVFNQQRGSTNIPESFTADQCTISTTRGSIPSEKNEIELRVRPTVDPSKLEKWDEVLLINIELGSNSLSAVLLLKAGGLKEGDDFHIPLSWRAVCRSDVLNANCDGSTVLRSIKCGEEIVITKQQSITPPEDTKPPLIAKELLSSDTAGFDCPRCGKVFSYEYYRDKHIKYTRCVDQGDRKFPCPICARSFEKRDRLRIHVLHVHENHRPHACSICGKAFSQSSSLNKHLRVHSGERPYKCSFCPKAFTASSILRTHIRQHSGEKPFKCAFCGKAFASHAAHDSHVRRTHAEHQ